MNCIDLMSKRSKIAKLQKQSNYDQFASIWRQNDQKCWVTSQNILNNAKLQNWSNYNELHRFDIKTIKNVELRRKTLKTTQNAKLQKQSNKDQFASIWRQNDQKCWVTSQNIQNNAKLRKSSNYNELHRFDVKNIKPTQNYKSDLISMNLHRFDVRTIKTTQNYESDQIIMHCIDLTSKRSKIAKLQKQSNYDQFASIWRQNDQKCWVTSQNILNNAKLQNWSNYNELHRFDIKTIKNVELRRKTLKTTQNAKLQKQSNKDQFASIWRQNDQKCWVTSQNILNNAKLQNWSNYNELHRFDVKTSKNRKTTKAIK